MSYIHRCSTLGLTKGRSRLQTYLESEPERKKAALEAKKEKLAKLERQAGIIPGSSKDGNPHAGQKRRLDDTEFLEESQAIVENVKSSVVEGASSVLASRRIAQALQALGRRRQRWTLLRCQRRH